MFSLALTVRHAHTLTVVPCSRCLADPAPSRLSQPRECAFDDSGAFRELNWNCATIAFLLGHPLAHDFLGQSESIQFVPAMTAVVDGESGEPSKTDVMQDGWLVLTRAGREGRVSSLVHLGDFFPPSPVTLAMLDDTIEGLRKQAQISTGLVSVN